MGGQGLLGAISLVVQDVEADHSGHAACLQEVPADQFDAMMAVVSDDMLA